MAGVGDAIDGTAPVLDSVTSLIGQQLPSTIEATQSALESVASSAKVVDDVLAMVTAFPLLRMDRYSPDVPLNQGLLEVSSSLNDVPASLKAAETGLSATSGSLVQVKDDFDVMAASIGEISTSLDSAQSVLDQYQDVVGGLQDQLGSLRRSLPNWLHTARLGLSLVLIWLGIAQIGLMTQGWDLIERSRRRRGPAGPEPEAHEEESQEEG
jgi:hypothetical protein